MDTAHIAKLLEPFLGPQDPTSNTQHLFSSISTYIDILLRWNARINLTAIRDPEHIIPRHFGESLFAASHLFPQSSSVSSVVKGVDGESAGGRTGGRPALQGRVTDQGEPGALAPACVADLGSGAGFPGLPIKLWASNISLTLVESNHKKVAFLHEVTRALTLTDVNIQNARAETLGPMIYDVVTLRAVERFEAILPTAAALVAPAGRLALLISSAQEAPARSALPYLAWSAPTPIPQSRSRILLVARRSS